MHLIKVTRRQTSVLRLAMPASTGMLIYCKIKKTIDQWVRKGERDEEMESNWKKDCGSYVDSVYGGNRAACIYTGSQLPQVRIRCWFTMTLKN